MADFRIFKAEADEVLGTFDGRAITIERGSTASREVAVHEYIHERLFHETLDGVLHRVLIRRSDQDGDFEADDRSSRLMTETEFAHEAAATYLGVQALDGIEERADTFSQLPPEYQEHYKVMGDVITPLTSSTFLAFTLGWSLAFWAFHSARIFEIYQEGWNSFDAVLTRVPSPTERLRAGVVHLRTSGSAWLEAGLWAAASAYAEDGELPWDVHDDERWRAQPQSSIARLETLLSAALWRWLRDYAPCPSAGPEKRPEGFDRWLLDQLDVPPQQRELVVKDDAFDADPENELVLAATGALRAGRARVTNGSALKIERVPTRQPHDRRRALKRFLNQSPAMYFIGSASPCGTKGWAVHIYRRDALPGLAANESVIADRFIVVEDFALELISMLKSTAIMRDGDRRSLFMAAVHAATLETRLEDLKALLGSLPSVGASLTGWNSADWPLWYWTDDWPTLLSSSGAATGALRLELGGTGLTETYILHVAKMNGVPGYIIKLTAPLPGDAILRYEAALKSGGSLLSMPEEEIKNVTSGLSGYIGIVVENWYVF